MMNFLRYYNLIFVLLCFASFSCSKSEDEPKKSNKAEITSWKFSTDAAAIKEKDISITLPFGTDVKKLTAEVKISTGASIDPDPKTARDYTNSVNFTVTAEDGTTKKTYTVTVKIEQNKDAEITSWKFSSNTATIKGKDISITLPPGTNVKNLKATAIISAGATISPDPNKAQDYTNPVDFTVTAKDGKTKITYTVTVTVAKKNRGRHNFMEVSKQRGIYKWD